MNDKLKGYHHGDLREALIAATDEILREKGVEGFSLRAAARRAGVTPGAPAHHFGNASGLLTEVAVLAYLELDTYLTRALRENTSAIGQARALAAAYVNFALDYPGRFRLMFRKDLVNRENPEYKEASWQALVKFAVVTAKLNGWPVEELLEKKDYSAVIGAWSLAHGIAQLALEEKFNTILSGDFNADFRERLLPDILKARWP